MTPECVTKVIPPAAMRRGDPVALGSDGGPGTEPSESPISLDALVLANRIRVERFQADRQLGWRWQLWRERFTRHRLGMLVGTGLASGMTVALLSPKRWSRVGAILFGSSAWLVRSPIGPALLGVLWAHMLRPTATRPPSRGVAATSDSSLRHS